MRSSLRAVANAAATTRASVRLLSHNARSNTERSPEPAINADTRRDVEYLYGVRAVRAALRARQRSAIRLAYARERAGPGSGGRAGSGGSEVAALVSEALACGVPCFARSVADLDAIAKASHHEGVCMTLSRRAAAPLATLLARAASAPRFLAVALDGVHNAANIGAVVRTMAFLGVEWLLLPPGGRHAPLLAPSAMFAAQGGGEFVSVVRAPLAATLAELRARAGVVAIAASHEATQSYASARVPLRAVLVMGSESTGLSPDVRTEADSVVAIRGSGRLESLNVSVAAGVLLSHAVAAHASE